MKKKFLFILFLLLYFSLLILLSLTFFQQDEWHAFGVIQSYGLRYITLDKSLFMLLVSDRVGSRIITYFLFKMFGLSSIPFGILAATIHLLNAGLIFLLSKKILKNVPAAIVSALFFLINAVSHQAYTWFGTFAGSATSVTFILFSLIFYFEFLKKRTMKLLLVSLGFIYFSLFFKESGYFLFLLYPAIWILYTKKKTFGLFIKENVFIICYGIVMTVILAVSIIAIRGDRANYIAPTSSGVTKLFFHGLLYPIEGFVQVFLPSGLIFPLSRILTVLFIPNLTPDTAEFDLFYTTKMVEGVSLGLFTILAIYALFLYKRAIKKLQGRIRLSFLFSILFIILSFLPYVVLDKFDGYLDSRYYYPAAIGAALLVGILFSLIKKKVIICLVFFAFITHFIFLSLDLFYQVQVGNERKQIIQDITKYVPNLRPKTVFFITGNSSGYYALPELKVPFQSGLGQVLLVVYGEKGQVDPNLFKEKTLLKTLDMGFLYDTLAEGYKQTKVQGFGYFYKEVSLKKALESGKFDKSDVVSLYYDSDEKKLKLLSSL